MINFENHPVIVITFYSPSWLGQEIGTFRSSSQTATCLPRTIEALTLSLLFCWTSCREAVNTNFSSPWFDPTGNQTQVFRFSNFYTNFNLLPVIVLLQWVLITSLDGSWNQEKDIINDFVLVLLAQTIKSLHSSLKYRFFSSRMKQQGYFQKTWFKYFAYYTTSIKHKDLKYQSSSKKNNSKSVRQKC